MKLIRITSDDDNGLFETQFNQNVNIKPMSKIALNNLTANLKPVKFNSQAEEITYSFSTTTSPDDFITNANILNNIYDRNNYGVMMDAITNGFNGNLNYVDATPDTYLLGSQFNASILDEKVNIDFRIGYNSRDWINENVSNRSLDTTVQTSPTRYMLSDTVASTADYNEGFYGNYNLAKGIGYFRAQIDKLNQDAVAPSGLNGQGFIIGLSSTVLPDQTPDDFTDADIDYAIGVGWDGAGWTMYGQRGSTLDDFSVAPTFTTEGEQENSVLEVRINGDRINLCYSISGTSTPVVERTYIHTTATPLYPFMIFHSNKDYVKASYAEVTFDPFIFPVSYRPREFGIQEIFKVPSNTIVTTKEINFGTQGLANFLGFNNIINSTTQFAVGNQNFIGEKLFYPAINTRNFILELLTFNIESYDSSQKQRKNILSSVITSNQDDVINNEPNIIFIDINNSQELDIRNLQLRLVDTEYNPIELSGKSTLTLLVADTTEKSF